jgi:general secretion pathway protein E
LYNIGIEPYLVGATVVGVMAQRLVRKLCQHCKEPYEPASTSAARSSASPAGRRNALRPKGCSRCRNLGFSGRIGIYELLSPTTK